ncbi:MAG: lipocalin family protein [Rhodobacterales bacterium]|nr:lipocalin family protein [Rhodobacterales bacterium]
MKPLLLSVLLLAACVPHVASPDYWDDPMTLRADVSADRLAGRWYEIARFPTPFQTGCSHVTADYVPQPGGGLAVVNRCRRAGGVEQVAGKVMPAGPGQFRVTFEGVPLAGAYWIVDLSADGRTLLVATPGRTAGWVLHRDRRMTPMELTAAAGVFDRNGYDVAALQRTDQR